MSIKELLVILNTAREAKGEKPLKSWSKKREILEELVKKMSRKSPTSKRVSIATVCREGFAKNLSNEQIHDQLIAKAVDKYNEDKKWYIQWYRASEARKAAKSAA